MRHLFIILGLIFNHCVCVAQYDEVARFTIANGLPTNTIYNCLEDKHGFLWIATDQGAIRFDGTQFQQFTTEHGLPDNEVLKILKEKNGRIWIHSFKQTPAYFDDVKNRFISAKEDTLLKNIYSRRLLFCHNTLNGGIEFVCENGTSIFENGRKYEYKTANNSEFGELILKRFDIDNRIVILHERDAKELSLGHFYKNKIIVTKSYHTLIDKSRSIQNVIYKNILYSLFKPENINKGSQLICISNIQSTPFQFDKDVLDFKKVVNQISITEHYIIPSYLNNEFEIYDRQTKKLLQTITSDYIVNSVFEDAKGTLWVCTTNKGMIKFQKSLAAKMVLPLQLNDILYMNVAVNNNGGIYLGTSDNRIIEMQYSKIKIHTLPSNNSISGWQRDMLFSQNKIFTFSDAGNYINFKKPILIPLLKIIFGSKCAVVFNDSILIFGNYQTLCNLNSKTEKAEILPNAETRVTSLLTYNASTIYYGSLDGIHKYDVEKRKEIPLIKCNALLEERVSSLCMSKDSIVWIATAGKGIIAVRHDSVIAHITKLNGLPTNMIRTLSIGKKNQILIGSNEGISLLDYSTSISKPSIKNISTSDGLSSNIINKIIFYNDTIYAATDKGVSIIPASIAIPIFDIPVKLINVKINDRDTLLVKHYELSAKQNNINLQFAGIELSGHYRNAQLSLNKGETWENIEGNNLSLQLGSGEHPVWLRAFDVNRNVSKQILKLQFNIATPFYRTWWFVILMSALLTGALIWLFSRRKLLIKEQQYEKQLALEAQRTQITADLHDDIGSTLSSLQVNSNIAGKLMDRDQIQVREILKKIERQSQNLSDKLGDFVWSMKPSKDEFMSLDNRIKSFASEIIGSTGIHYEIKINKGADLQLSDFSMRKNILMIVKEAINNAVKYSQASEIKISLRTQEGHLIILIIDDGIGMDLDHVVKGNGLNNMKKRAEEIDGEFMVISSLGQGTQIIVKWTIPNISNMT